jgi:glucose/arabinose dehydrogenase
MTAVVRGRLRDGHWGDEQRIFDPSPTSYRISPVHFGSRLAFDKNGFVFLSIGDRAFSEEAQNLGTPNGKVHRFHEDGRIPEDNPFAGRLGAVGSIWTWDIETPRDLPSIRSRAISGKPSMGPEVVTN